MGHDKQHALDSTADHSATSDTTDLNASASAHGLLPKLAGGSTQFLRADGTWAVPPGNGFHEYHFFADQMDPPDNADWAVNALAPLVNDADDPRFKIRTLDDTDEEGVGLPIEIPSGATNIRFDTISKAVVGAASNLSVVPRLYECDVPDNADIPAWSGGTDMTALTMGTSNTYFQYDNQTFTLAALGLTAGRATLLQLTRNTGAGGDTLVGKWGLYKVKVSFS